MKKITSFSALLLFAFTLVSVFYSPTSKAKTKYPKAPGWVIEEWVVGPPTSLVANKGKVVIVDFFQLWCPGCNSFSIPLMSQWEKKYEKQQQQGKIVFVSIHTVFEGHNYQTTKRLKKFVKEKGMHHPVGVDYLAIGQRLPTTMVLYQTRGTPEIAIIDKDGFIRFQKFGGFDPEPVEKLIDELLSETKDS